MPKPGEPLIRTSWTQLRLESTTLRRRIASVVQEAETIAGRADVDAISAWQALQSELTEWTKEAGAWLERANTALRRVEVTKSEQIETLSQRIVKRLGASGHTVFGDAELLIVDGIAHIELDPGKGRGSVNQVPIDSFDPAEIADIVFEEISRLRKLSTEPTVMLERLLTAYDREVRANDLRPGSPVQATALLLQLAALKQTNAFRMNPTLRLFKEYPQDVFRADLYALLSSGQLTINSKTLRYASGADTSGAIFLLVPALGRPAHLGRIWFEDKATGG